MPCALSSGLLSMYLLSLLDDTRSLLLFFAFAFFFLHLDTTSRFLLFTRSLRFLETSFHPVDLGYPKLNIESGILSFGLDLDFGFSCRPRVNAPPTLKIECTVFLFRHHGRFTALMASGVGRQLLFILLQHLLVPTSLIPFFDVGSISSRICRAGWLMMVSYATIRLLDHEYGSCLLGTVRVLCEAAWNPPCWDV